MNWRTLTMISMTLALGATACDERPIPQDTPYDAVEVEVAGVEHPVVPAAPDEEEWGATPAAVETASAKPGHDDVANSASDVQAAGEAGSLELKKRVATDVAKNAGVAGDLLAIKGPSDGKSVGVLQGTSIGEARGFGGLGLRGGSKGGGGISERGIGLGKVGAAGRGGGGRGAVAYGSASAGKMARGTARVPKVRVGSASVSGYGYGRGAGSLGNKSIHGRSVRVSGYRSAHAADRGGSEAYKDYGTNEFTDPGKDRFSTFAVDVDTGSYTIARKKLRSGTLPPAAAVRVEEFVNYFKYSYPAPRSGAFSVDLEAAPSPFTGAKNTYLMRVGVQAKRVAKSERKPVHLTFLVDVSGSMQRPDKLELAKRSLELLTTNLSQGDTVALATYAGRVAEILPPTGMERRGEILAALEGLTAGGSTAMSSGIDIAYKLASRSFKPGHVNRVIVLSDGDANVGPTSHTEILKQIKGHADKGVTLSTIGFGMGNYKDTTMEQLANKGNGNYYYIDDFKEAKRIFGDQLDGTLEVVAKDVKIQVEFDPTKVTKYRLVGYENRDVADKDFRNDKVDAGEIGAGHTVTAFYEVVLKPGSKAGNIATVRVRHKKPSADRADEAAFAFSWADVRTRVGDASKDFQFAAAVVGFAEKLRGSKYAKNLTYDLILETAKPAVGRRADRKEFVNLVRKAKQAQS